MASSESRLRADAVLFMIFLSSVFGVSVVAVAGRGQLLLEIEDFFEDPKALIRRNIAVLEQRGHLLLTPGVDVRKSHTGPRGVEAVAFEVADKQSVGVQVQRVVVLARVLQGRQRLWPHRGVVPSALPAQPRLDGGPEANPHSELLGVAEWNVIRATDEANPIGRDLAPIESFHS